MQIGSLVALKEPLNQKQIDYTLSKGLKTWPVKDDVYEINDMWKPDHGQWEMSITLVEFPMTEKGKMGYSVDMFVELLPPGVLLIQQMEPKEELMPI